MILYSIIPVDIVFGNNNPQDEARFFETRYMGEMVQVQQMEDNSYKIMKLISTCPKSYLNPDLQPGRIISNIKTDGIKQ